MRRIDDSGRSYLVREGVNWNTKCPCKTKIAKLELAFAVDEQILRFEVAV